MNDKVQARSILCTLAKSSCPSWITNFIKEYGAGSTDTVSYCLLPPLPPSSRKRLISLL